MAIYALSTLGVSDNQVVFNDFDYLYNTGVLFRMRKRSVTRRQLEEFDIPLPESNGVADFQSFIGKSYFLLEGTMYPNDETYFDLAREQLRKVASLSFAQADNFTNSGYANYVWTQTNGDRQIEVKVMYADVPEDASIGIVQPFRLLCKVKYPVITTATPVSAIIGTTSPSATLGSSELSFELPVLLGSSTYSFAGTMTNTGDLPAYPSFTITGPINHPRITSSSGEFIDVNVSLGSSDVLSIVYNQEEVSITVNGTSVYNHLSSDSTLFTIAPGDVSFTYSGSATSTGTQVSVSFYPTWPLS